MPTTDPVANAVQEMGGAVTSDPHEAVNLLCQESGPKIICVDRSQAPEPSTPLTGAEKSLIKRVLGGRREQRVLQEILESRGGVEPIDWQKLVVQQQIWFER